jgi:hypothetical protein
VEKAIASCTETSDGVHTGQESWQEDQEETIL